MKKLLLITILLPMMVFAQTPILYPTGMKTHREDFGPGGGDTTNKYLIAHSNAEPYVGRIQNIGDFNGDNSDEIYSIWYMRADYHIVVSGKDTVIDDNGRLIGYSLYSMKTNNVLLSEIRSSSFQFPSTVETGDFNGDNCIDFVIADKIYTTTTPIKKKGQ